MTASTPMGVLRGLMHAGRWLIAIDGANRAWPRPDARSVARDVLVHDHRRLPQVWRAGHQVPVREWLATADGSSAANVAGPAGLDMAPAVRQIIAAEARPILAPGRRRFTAAAFVSVEYPEGRGGSAAGEPDCVVRRFARSTRRAWIELQFLGNSGFNLSQIPVPVPKKSRTRQKLRADGR